MIDWILGHPMIWAPMGTVLGAMLVLTGVVLTIRWNRRQVRYQQLEGRAKNRESTLQQAYADFSSAAFDLFTAISHEQRIHAEMDRIKREATPQNLAKPHYKEIVEQQIDHLSEEVKAADAKRWAATCKVHACFGRLALIEDHQSRFLQVDAIYTRISGLQQKHSPKILTDLHNDLVAVCADVGFELRTQYRREAELAERGLYPVEADPTPSPTPEAQSEAPWWEFWKTEWFRFWTT